MRVALGGLLLLGLSAALHDARAQLSDGALTGTLDCPRRDFFDSGSRPVTGEIRGGEVTVRLSEVDVTGRQYGPLMRLDGTISPGRFASFTSVVLTSERIHLRGTVGDRPCNLNLTFQQGGTAAPVVAAPPPASAPAPAAPAPAPRPAVAGPPGSFDGEWAGTVDCPARDIFSSGSSRARGTVRNNQLTLEFGTYRVEGRIIDTPALRVLRLENASTTNWTIVSFDGVLISPERIHARGLVGGSPCNVNISPVQPVRTTPTQPPVIQAAPAPPPLPTTKPPPSNQAVVAPAQQPPAPQPRPQPAPAVAQPPPQQGSADRQGPSAAHRAICMMAAVDDPDCPRPGAR